MKRLFTIRQLEHGNITEEEFQAKRVELQAEYDRDTDGKPLPKGAHRWFKVDQTVKVLHKGNVIEGIVKKVTQRKASVKTPDGERREYTAKELRDLQGLSLTEAKPEPKPEPETVVCADCGATVPTIEFNSGGHKCPKPEPKAKTEPEQKLSASQERTLEAFLTEAAKDGDTKLLLTKVSENGEAHVVHTAGTVERSFTLTKRGGIYRYYTGATGKIRKAVGVAWVIAVPKMEGPSAIQEVN